MSDPSGGAGLPDFLLDDVKLLLSGLTSPESGVAFTPPGRADPSTIERDIDPPQATWTWPTEAARQGQVVNQLDLGKYGLQADTSTLYQLVSLAPVRWKPVQDFSSATWTWLNEWARTHQPVTAADVGKIGYQVDTNSWFRLEDDAPAVWRPVPGPGNTSPPFELSTGAADADSFHDFYRLQVAFEDVWAELIDPRIAETGQNAYAAWDALMDQTGDTDHERDGAKRFSKPPINEITGVAELTAFLANLRIELGLPAAPSAANVQPQFAQLRDALVDTLEACQMLLTELNRAGSHGGPVAAWDGGNWMVATAEHNDNQVGNDLSFFPGVPRGQIFARIISQIQTVTAAPPPLTPDPSVTFPDLAQLLNELDTLLKEKYQFDVFAPASINFGVLLNYRQHWRPQSYQVGNLVSTIPLAPQETRRYTSRKVVKRSRSAKEINDSVRSGKTQADTTWRVDAEIVDRAKNQTNFQANVSGSYGNGQLYKVSAAQQQDRDQAVESAQTKREFHESVVRTAQEYRNEHRMEVTTEESTESETTSFQEIRNPNDELTVTYLFYELQRRYLVSEALHKITPVILVANDVPAPHEIDQGWILRHDWIIKRVILDDSFLPALEYLSTEYTGAELALQTLGMSVELQKSVVDRISRQVQLADQALTAATLGLQSSQDAALLDQKLGEVGTFVKSFFDPLKLTQAGDTGDGNADRARIDFAKDTLNRAQAKVNQLVGDLRTEATALQTAVDAYVAATTTHFGMLAEIDRLRIHVKDNILHYMQGIWTYEPTDQRYFRLYDLDVPLFEHTTTLPFGPGGGLSFLEPGARAINVRLPAPTLAAEHLKLHQVADLDTLLGFKGNYMIFPVTDTDNYLIWWLMQRYIQVDDINGVIAADPDPGADLTLEQLRAALKAVKADSALLKENRIALEEIMFRLLSRQEPELVVVPSESLYIEALPGTHPLLEDFKLIHRAIDVKRAQAEARRAELENLRLAARLAADQLGDPDVDKVVVVGDGAGVTIDAGQ